MPTISGSDAIRVLRRQPSGYSVGDSAVYQAATDFVNLVRSDGTDLMGFDAVHAFLLGLAGDAVGWLAPPEAQIGVRHRLRQTPGLHRLPPSVVVLAEITAINRTPSGTRRLFEVSCELQSPDGTFLADFDMTLIETPKVGLGNATPPTPLPQHNATGLASELPSQPLRRWTEDLAKYLRHLRTSSGRQVLLRAAKRRLKPAVDALGERSREDLEDPISLALDCPSELVLGQLHEACLKVFNHTSDTIQADLVFANPGWGVELQGLPTQVSISPHTELQLHGAIAAHRPDYANAGKSWQCVVEVNSPTYSGTTTFELRVPEKRPGKFFYVLTEDCETFDGHPATGDYEHWPEIGNGNGWMDPEEYRVQMIDKPNALNAIAERHGATMTHYWATTQAFAARWAATTSSTGDWDRVLAELDQSIIKGSERHEYAVHIHHGFDPETRLTADPPLIYDSCTDGILPNDFFDPNTNVNHHNHGWDGGQKGIDLVVDLGETIDEHDTKLGTARKSIRWLAERTAAGKPSYSIRTGALDFGVTPQRVSDTVEAWKRNGIAISADVWHFNGTVGSLGPYFCEPFDLFQPCDDSNLDGVVQLAGGITMGTERLQSQDLNAKFAAEADAARRPGVSAVVSLNHAMFMRGAGDDFRSVQGGDFDQWDAHLGWVRKNYPDVVFATATEVGLAYLDYHTPVLLAYTNELTRYRADGSAGRWTVRLLGEGIPVDELHPHRTALQLPLCCDRSNIETVILSQNGHEVPTEFLDSPLEVAKIEFSATSRDPLELEVRFAPGSSGGLRSHVPTDDVTSTRHWIEVPARNNRVAARFRTASLVRTNEHSEEAPEFEATIPADVMRNVLAELQPGIPLARGLHPFTGFRSAALLPAIRYEFGPDWECYEVHMRLSKPWNPDLSVLAIVQVKSITDSALKLDCVQSQLGEDITHLTFELRRTALESTR